MVGSLDLNLDLFLEVLLERCVRVRTRERRSRGKISWQGRSGSGALTSVRVASLYELCLCEIDHELDYRTSKARRVWRAILILERPSPACHCNALNSRWMYPLCCNCTCCILTQIDDMIFLVYCLVRSRPSNHLLPRVTPLIQS